jgi:preprotein translocase subunit YajC
MFWTSVAHAMGGAPQGAEGGAQGGLISFLPLILMFVIFYFLLIRPQQKKQKDLRNMINNLKRGDRVVTGGGILGRIEALRDDKVDVEVAQGVVLTVLRSYIAGPADASPAVKKVDKKASAKEEKSEDKKDDSPDKKK